MKAEAAGAGFFGRGLLREMPFRAPLRRMRITTFADLLGDKLPKPRPEIRKLLNLVR
jgi:hypothetical protein